MSGNNFEMGMVGLGVMGRNLLLNIADHGFSVAGYDKDLSKVDELKGEIGKRDIRAFSSLDEFIQALKKPRTVMMLVPAGPPVDSVIHDLLPQMEAGDLIIDGGNSHFTDTNLRAKTLQEKDIAYLGVGISGGESGARHGPSMMPGGTPQVYERVKPIFEAAAAKVKDEPCVTFLGPGSAGHYVKMVHNGIEYGLMQLISETYHLMKHGLGLNNDELHEIYYQWNQEELNGYLMEITSNIFIHQDERTGKRLIDVILDEAKQKGTGMWTSQDAMEIGVPVPTIDVAVVMRNLSAFEHERMAASKLFKGPGQNIEGGKQKFIESLRRAFYAAMILTYAQGMDQLRRASDAYHYDLNLEHVARIWRGGCIIRAALLEDIRAAFVARPDLLSLMLDPNLAQAIAERQNDLRTVVRSAAELGIPAPGMMVSLAYLDAYRNEWLPANLIQAQRDYFGAHTYERIDAKGVFHTKWE